MNISLSLVRYNLRCHRVVLGLLSIVAILFNICIATNNRSDLLLTFVFGGFLAAVAEFFLCFARQGRTKRWGRNATIILQTLVVADSIWFFLSGQWPISVIIGHFAAMASVLLLIPIASFRAQKDDIAHQTFIFQWIRNLLLSGLFWLVVGALIFAWVYGIFTLCDAVGSNTFTITFECLGVWALYFGTSFYILVRPRLSHRATFSRGIARTFLIIFTLYLLALYANLIVCICNWSLPNGGVTWLACIMMFIFYLVWALYYPFLKTPTNNKKDQRIQQQLYPLPLLTLPLLIFMTVAIWRRIADYGITINRLYVVTLNIWFYAIVAIMMLKTRKGKPLSFCVTSITILLLATCVIPGLNYYDITETILTRQIDRTVKTYGANTFWPKNNDEIAEWLLTIPRDQARRTQSQLQYLQSQYSKNVTAPWCEEYLRHTDLDTPTTDPEIVLEHQPDIHLQTSPVPAGNWKSIYFTKEYTKAYPGTPHKYYSRSDSAYHLPIVYLDAENHRIEDTLILSDPWQTIDGFIVAPTANGGAAVFQTFRLTFEHDTEGDLDATILSEHLHLIISDLQIFIPKGN